MEQKQSVAFLTDVVEIERQNVIKQKIEVSTLRHNIKILAHQLPPREIINQVLANLGLNYSIVTLGLNLEKEKNLTLSDLKRIYFQLKMIQRETVRLKNSNNLQVPRAAKQAKSSSSSRSVSNFIDKHRTNLRYSRSNANLENEDQNSKLKKEILKELSYRKFVTNLKNQNHSDKHKEFLLNKVKKVKQMNKRCEKIHQKNAQLLKLNYQENFNKLKQMEHEDYSIWANRTGRNAITAATKFRTHSITHPKQPIQLHKNYSKGHLISQRNVKFEEILAPLNFELHDQIKPTSIRKNSPSNQEQRLTLQTSEIKRRSVLRRKNMYDQEKLSKAIEKVVKKNITIESLHRKKTSERDSVQKQQKQKISDSDFFKVGTSFVTQANEDKSVNIMKKVEQKILKKQEINRNKSMKLKEAFLRNRERFLWRRNQIDKQNEEKIMTQNEQQMSFRQVNQKKIQSKQLRIQRIIRKTRQKMELKQIFCEQISNLKKLSDSSLQKKLHKYQNKVNATIKAL